MLIVAFIQTDCARGGGGGILQEAPQFDVLHAFFFLDNFDTKGKSIIRSISIIFSSIHNGAMRIYFFIFRSNFKVVQSSVSYFPSRTVIGGFRSVQMTNDNSDFSIMFIEMVWRINSYNSSTSTSRMIKFVFPFRADTFATPEQKSSFIRISHGS